MPHGNPDGPIVLTIGDVSFDWLCFAIDRDQKKKGSAPIVQQSPHVPLAWSLGSRVEYPVVHGGAWYVDTYIRMLLGPEDRNRIFTYRRFSPGAMRVVESGVMLHSFTEYSLFDGSFRNKGPTVHEFKRPDEDRVYRAKDNPRFNGPPNHQLSHPQVESRSDLSEEDRGDHIGAKATSTKAFLANLNKPRPFPSENPRIVVVFDRGNGFSSLEFARARGGSPSGPATESKGSTAKRAEANWSQALPSSNGVSGRRASARVHAVILAVEDVKRLLGERAAPSGAAQLRQSTSPKEEHQLWQYLDANGYLARTVVVVDVDDLRRAGVQISRSESWERTGIDFVSQLKSNRLLKMLSSAGHLVVRFGVSGLIHHTARASDLYFDPQFVEGEYRDPKKEGRMFGYGPVVCATLAAHLYERAKAQGRGRLALDIDESLAKALANCRSFFRHGCGTDASGLAGQAEQWDRMAAKKRSVMTHRRLPGIRFTVSTFYEFDPVSTYAPGDDANSRAPADNAPAVPATVSIYTDPAGKATLCRRPSDVVDAIADKCREEFRSMMKDFGIDEESISTATPKTTNGSRSEWKYSITKSPATRAWAEVTVRVESRNRRANWEEAFLQYLRDRMTEWSSKDEDRGKFVQKLINDIEPLKTAAQKVKVALQRIIQHAHEMPSRKMHWRYCWPVCVYGLNEFKVFAHARIQNKPEWRILDPGQTDLAEVAKNIVKRGVDKVLSAPDSAFPIARFEGLVTVDRMETESYRSIRNLIREYNDKARPARPLCIAVFGPPGSGKSFGVKQIAATISEKSKSYEFNLAQFSSTDDLRKALIQIRDDALGGTRPLVFFDEFDSSFDKQPLGWLKHFLSVMQDGEFKHGDLTLKIGNPILVFAGGTSASYEKFTQHYRELTRKESQNNKKGREESKALEEIKAAKVPDFVSRLRGFVDTTGPDPRDEDDHVCIIRRAVMIRGIIERQYSDLLRDGEAQIDEGVLNALLHVPSYEHGIRSIEAIFEMSTLAQKKRFEKSALPPREQLEMHLFRSKKVNSPREFARLLREPGVTAGGHKPRASGAIGRRPAPRRSARKVKTRRP
jgi:ATPase family associated with various cellular activities (AAA)